MKLPLFSKILLLVAALVVVIFAIRSLNANKIENAFEALGIESGTSASPGLQPATQPLKPGEERFTLCPTRITAIESSTGWGVKENDKGLKLQWQALEPANNGQPRELSYLEMEKWLSRHCQIVVRAADPAAAQPTADASDLSIRYVDGSQIAMKRWTSADGTPYFDLGGHRVVRSPDFADAIKELRDLAQISAGR